MLVYLIVDLSFTLIAFHLMDMHIRWKDFLICVFNSHVCVKSILYLMVKVDWYLHCLTEVMLWNVHIPSAFDRHYWHLMYTLEWVAGSAFNSEWCFSSDSLFLLTYLWHSAPFVIVPPSCLYHIGHYNYCTERNNSETHLRTPYLRCFSARDVRIICYQNFPIWLPL